MIGATQRKGSGRQTGSNNGSLPHLSHKLSPALERLPLRKSGVAHLLCPGFFLDEFGSDVEQLALQLCYFRLKFFKRQFGSTIQFFIQLAPKPRLLRIMRNLTFPMMSKSFTDSHRPSWCHLL